VRLAARAWQLQGSGGRVPPLRTDRTLCPSVPLGPATSTVTGRRVLRQSGGDQAPGSRIAANRHDRPQNLVPVFRGAVPGQALVDSGAVRSIVSGDMYRRILKNGTKLRYVNETIPNLFSADSSPMEAQAVIDIDVKLGE